MKYRVSVAAAIAMLAMPIAAHAQGVPGGFSHGVQEGNRIAGPVGAVVGGAVGGVIGGIEAVLGMDYSYQSYPEVLPPPRIYRHRKAARLHARHPRRSRHT
jgi:hypothetical protein